MSFFIGLLTFVLVLVCLALILLVLIQLPKKEAGAGLAFGGGATDALFGAGTGNVLTKATKYAAAAFFVLTIVIGMLQSRFSDRAVTELERAAEAKAAATATALPLEQPAPEPVVAPITETSAPAAATPEPAAPPAGESAEGAGLRVLPPGEQQPAPTTP
jgi:preprotein translocase subunit SecG